MTKTILVTDDREDTRIILRHALERQGYCVHTRADGEQALQFLASGAHVDAVLLDLTMPRMDGLTVTRRTRSELGMAVPIIMMTALDSPEYHIAGYDAGVNYYMTKPVSTRRLITAIEFFTGNRLSEEELRTIESQL